MLIRFGAGPDISVIARIVKQSIFRATDFKPMDCFAAVP
jgi:hypothetical protein